jgi:uncharacterized membrane protein YfcA
MPNGSIINSLLAGIIAGLASGFLGVSPGGILVPVITLLLPFSQHVAQAVSLVVQAPPTSVSSLAAYSRKGNRVAIRPVLLVSLGFIAGGPVGALLARACSERELRWMFVGYLLILTTLSILKRSKSNSTTSAVDADPERHTPFDSAILIGVGVIAGISSGLLGIGGGLAITALSVLLLHKRQHEAQALSLAVTALPLTLPAAWVYVHQGLKLPWRPIVFLIVGLVIGGWIGAAFANRLPEKKLKLLFTCVLLAMATYMIVRAIRS